MSGRYITLIEHDGRCDGGESKGATALMLLLAFMRDELVTLGGSSEDGEPPLTFKFIVELNVVVEPGERVSKSLLPVIDSLLCSDSNGAEDDVLIKLLFFFCCSTLFYTMRLISSLSMSGS